jgi:hypothetical protein
MIKFLFEYLDNLPIFINDDCSKQQIYLMAHMTVLKS